VIKRLPGGDTQPWYRQFWPWFLIALPASVVVAALATAYIAHQGADDLVVQDYYKDGLAINRQLEKEQRAAQLGISATLQFSTDSVRVKVTGPVTDTELQLLLSHPMEADSDFSVTLARVSPELYSGTLVQGVAPHWHWRLEQKRENGWRLDGSVQAPDIDNVPRD
jgi:uncharacterized protein